MNTRKLGYTDLYLTRLGLGTWAIGGRYASELGPHGFPQDNAESIAAIRRALDLGLNWIDTAPIYGLGHSEEVVGKAIQGRRHEVIVATKCGRVWGDDPQKLGHRLKAESVRQEVENSLRRLNIEVIDLYQMHFAQPDEDIEEAWGVMGDLAKQGKVRYIGVSNFSVSQLQRLQPIHPVASLQPRYSMLTRGVEKDLLSYCAANNIGVIVYSPMETGLLTGKFTKERMANLPEDDWRRRSPDFQEPALSVNLELVEKLQRIAQRNKVTVAQLPIAWALRRPEVTAAIVGARRPSQIEETAAAVDWELSADDLAEIDTLLEQREKALASA